MAHLLLHNPRCSKSRAAKQWLEDAGADFQVREYLKQPLSLDELRVLKKKIGRPVSEWLRWGQDEAAGLERDAPELELLQAVAAHPILLERPILIKGDDAAVGRPDPVAAFAPLIR